ncbi:MAG: hypothetical protein FWE72_01850 [Spirochaetaceae bacterium]|nr:hypothetical protein [Spirochaetaceae bacterium]
MTKNIIIIILIIVLEAVFATLNIKNVSDISIGFKVFTDIPVFITITISFLTGALIFFPIAFFAGKKYSKSSEEKEAIKIQKKMLKEKKSNEIKPVE